MHITRRKSFEILAAGTAAGTTLGLAGPLAGIAEATTSPALPFDMPSWATMQATRRKTIGMWHCFPISTANRPPASDYYSMLLDPNAPLGFQPQGGYARQRPLPRDPRPEADWMVLDGIQDIQNGMAAGLDAFMFNMVTPSMTNVDGQRFTAILEAARRLDNGFKIIPCVDFDIIRATSTDAIVACLVQVANHPAVMRRPDGRLVLGVWKPESWTIADWRILVGKLADRGIGLYTMFVFGSWAGAQTEWGQIGDVLSPWGGSFDDMGINGNRAAYARSLGKQFMPCIWPQDFRPKSFLYYEAYNTVQFRQGWAQAMTQAGDYVMLATWNDLSEGSDVAPSTGIQYGFADLCAYYSTAFKTGRYPTILRDVLYYCHRIQNSAPANTTRLQSRRFDRYGTTESQNQVEMLGFLTASGDLEIDLAGRVTRRASPAGFNVLRTPLVPGRPSFRLRRNGTVITQVTSAFTINASADYQDLLYRAGSSSRLPVPGVR